LASDSKRDSRYDPKKPLGTDQDQLPEA
jgi:hypothetical protein